MSGTLIANLPAAALVGDTDLMIVEEIGTPNVTKRASRAQVVAQPITTAAITVTGGAAIAGSATVAVNLGVGANVSVGGTLGAGSTTVTGNLSVSGTSALHSTAASLLQAGTLTILNGGSGCVVVEHTLGASVAAVAALNASNAAGATCMLVRNERTDGVSIQFSLGATPIGNITNDGSVIHYNTTSDENLKVRVGCIEFVDAAKVIDKLVPLWFTWKASPDRGPEPGFFAQQVYRIYPWAVTKGRGRPGSKFFRAWQMDASKFMPLVIAYIQGLGRSHAELERRVAMLERR